MLILGVIGVALTAFDYSASAQVIIGYSLIGGVIGYYIGILTIRKEISDTIGMVLKPLNEEDAP